MSLKRPVTSCFIAVESGTAMSDEGKEKRAGELFEEPSYYGSSTLGLPRDPSGRITLDWSHNPNGEMVAWAECFQFAAQTLVRDLYSRIAYTDREACPIVFLYRHSLELCLKGLVLQIATLRQMEGEESLFPEQILSKHELKALAETLEPVFSRFSYSSPSRKEVPYCYADLMALVQELDRLDRGSYAFRYPVEKDFASPSLPVHLHFDIGEFALHADGALNALRVLGAAVDRAINAKFLDEEEAFGGA